MAEAMSGRHWSIARLAASVLLLVLALAYAGITALFVLLLSSPWGTSLRIGDDIVLHSEFASTGTAIFSALCLLAGYAGLATLIAWRGARLVTLAASWATIALGLHGLWLYANMLTAGLPFLPFSIGMQSPPSVSLALCVIGTFVLWAMRKAIDKSPSHGK
jgi:hypothetical protein